MQQYLIEKKNNGNFHYWLVFLFVLLIIIFGYYFFTPNIVPEPYRKAHEIYQVSQQIELQGLGSIESKNRNLIAAPEQGQVTTLTVRAGQLVKQGDVLIEITNYRLKQEAQKFEYQLVNVRADVALKKADLLIKKYQLETSLEKARTQVNKQQLELSANEKLVEKGIVSQIKFNQSKMNFQQVQFDVRSWQQQLALFNDIYQQQVKALDAKIEAAEKQVRYINQRIKTLTVTASVSGVVREVNISIGQVLNQGQRLFEIIDVKRLLAKIQIPQYSSQYLSIGQKATIVTPNGELAAHVENIDSVIRQGTINVYLALETLPPEWLKIEQSIEAVIKTAKQKTLLAIKKPVNFDKNKWVVYKSNQENKLIKIDATLLDTANEELLIKGPVNIGENVFLIPLSVAVNAEYALPEKN